MTDPARPFGLARFTLFTPAFTLFAQVAGLVSLSLVLACAGLESAEPQIDANERAALVAARTTLTQDPEKGERELRAFLEQHPDSPLADDAAWALAKHARDDGDIDAAAEWLTLIVTRYDRSDRSDAARLAMAGIERDRGNDDKARQLMGKLRLTQLTEPEQARAFRLLADMADSPIEQLRWLAPLRALAVTTGDLEAVATVDREIDVLLDGMTADDLDTSADRLDESIPASRIHLRLAERALDAGDFDEAGRALTRASRRELAPEYKSLMREMQLRLDLRQQLGAQSGGLPTFAEVAKLPAPRTEGANGTIGVVLPLSGPFAAYGEQSLKGVLLAARIFDETGRVMELPSKPGAPAPGGITVHGLEPSLEAELAEGVEGVAGAGVRVLVRDSGGTPEGAARAVRELADDRRVTAIVGPLLSGESEAAAREADEAEIPLIALTSREEVPRMRNSVFRLRTTPWDEVTHLVDYAVDQAGAQRFAILYPKDNYGRGMRQRFWQAVDRRGGHVVAVASYDPKATDFAEPIRSMIGYSMLTRKEKTALEERDAELRRARRLDPEEASEAREKAYAKIGPEGLPLPPVVDFDALFIPDSHENIVLIAPQLAFHEITDVQLLGPGAWYHPDLVTIGRDHVRGAVFSAPFHPDSGFVFVSRFVERFSTTYGEAPDLYAAQAFDAANLILVQLAAGRETRDDVRDGVLHTQGYPGVAGVTSFLPDGNARKRPFLLGVKRGEIISLD